MMHLTDTWPNKVRPEKKEIFSSWLASASLGNGLALNTVISILYGDCYFRKRDIDKYATLEVIKKLCDVTNVSIEEGLLTSLPLVLGKASCIEKNPYQAEWVTPANNIYTRHKSYGYAFCPICLTEDKRPYFRLEWRVSFVTACPIHKVLLLDRCPRCHSEVNLYKLPQIAISLAKCYSCKFDLRKSTTRGYEIVKEQLGYQQYLMHLVDWANADIEESPAISDFFAVLYDYVHLVTRNYTHSLEKQHRRLYRELGAIHDDENHRTFDKFSILNRFKILRIAFTQCNGFQPCNFLFYSMKRLTTPGLSRRKQIPCGTWCEKHDYLNISKDCEKKFEKILR